MHVSAKKMAFAGLLVAMTVILLTLSSVIETNSLFMIAAASFCIGIVIREWKIGFGAIFLVSSTLLSLLIVPDKFYCITYAAMGVYLLLSEWLWEKLAEKSTMKHRYAVLWIGKYLVFNCMYIPILLFYQELLFAKAVSGEFLVLCVFAGQLILFVYEKAYCYFQAMIWGRVRAKVLRNF